MRILGYINVYKSGYFHRRGKPGVCDRHGGDIYLDQDTALADIHPRRHYVCTVPIFWEEAAPPEANPPHSEPIAIHLTRKLDVLG